MSVDAVKWAIKQKTGDVTAKSVLRMLAWHHNPETGLCCPSIPLLQEECDIKSDNTVKAALKRLVAAGLIASEREMANGAIKRTRYTLIGFDPSNIGGGSNIEGGSNITPGEGQILPLQSLKDCPSVPQILPPKEKIEREEEKSKVSCALPAGSSAADLCPSVDEFGLTNDYPVEAVKPKKQTKKAKAITHAFDLETLPEDWAVYCKEVRPDLDPARVFSAFKAYWTMGRGKGTLRADKSWFQSWMNWVKKEDEARTRNTKPVAVEEFSDDRYANAMNPDGSLNWD